MSKPLDRLGLLETFVRIAERGSISGAARDLGMSQGSASRQLKDLEQRLGVQLIRRTTHSLALTDSGWEVLADARQLIAAWDTLEEQHSSDAEEPRGTLQVVAPVALGQLYLADIAIHFQTANPQVRLNWRLEDEPIRFAEWGCDCWIKIGHIRDDTLVVRRLGCVERLIVCTPAITKQLRDQTPRSIEQLPFVTLSPFDGETIQLWSGNETSMNISVHNNLSTNNIMTLKRSILASLGAGVLPRWLVEEELQAGTLVDLLPRWRAATLDVNLAYLPARRQPRRLSAFIEELTVEILKLPGIQE